MTEPTADSIKAALQGAHMELEELQAEAEGVLGKGKLYELEHSIQMLDEAANFVHEAVLRLDEITPKGT